MSTDEISLTEQLAKLSLAPDADPSNALNLLATICNVGVKLLSEIGKAPSHRISQTTKTKMVTFRKGLREISSLLPTVERQLDAQIKVCKQGSSCQGRH